MRDHARTVSLDEYNTYIHSLERYIALHKKLRAAKTLLFNSTVKQWLRNPVLSETWPYHCFVGKQYNQLVSPQFRPIPHIPLDDSSRALSTLLMFVEVELDFENLPAPEPVNKNKSWFKKLARLFFVKKSTKKRAKLLQQYQRLYTHASALRRASDEELYLSLPAYKQFQTMAQRSIKNLNPRELQRLGIKDAPLDQESKAKQQISFSSLLALSDAPYTHPHNVKRDSGVEICLDLNASNATISNQTKDASNDTSSGSLVSDVGYNCDNEDNENNGDNEDFGDASHIRDEGDVAHVAHVAHVGDIDTTDSLDSRSDLGLSRAFDGLFEDSKLRSQNKAMRDSVELEPGENPFQRKYENLDVDLDKLDNLNIGIVSLDAPPTFEVGEICSPSRISVDSEITRISTYSGGDISNQSSVETTKAQSDRSVLLGDAEWYKEEAWDELKGLCIQIEENYIKSRLQAEMKKTKDPPK